MDNKCQIICRFSYRFWTEKDVPVVCVSSRTNNTASKTVLQMPELCISAMFHSAMLHSAMFHSVNSRQILQCKPHSDREYIKIVKCYKLTARLLCTTKKTQPFSIFLY